MGNHTSPATVKNPGRFLRLASAAFLLLLAAASTYTWYFLQRSCERNAVQEAASRLIRQRDRYDHSYLFATSASPSAVVRPVAELQQILMDTQDVQVPACMQTAKHELISYMGTVIRAFLAYGAQEPDASVRDLIEQSEAHYNRFTKEMETVNRCAPFCLP